MMLSARAVRNSTNLKHGTTKDEYPLFLPLHPLDDLIRALCKPSTRYIRTSNTVELEKWRGPCQRDTISTDTMKDFEMVVLGMRRCVKTMVQRDKPTND